MACSKHVRVRHDHPEQETEIARPGDLRWVNWLFPFAGLVSLIWVFIRVAPKPSRVAYPCQRVTLPLAGGFLLWLGSVVGSALAYRQAKLLYRRSKPALAAACLALAGAAGLIALFRTPAGPVVAADLRSNDPIGDARGIHPGRVVWVHDAHATDWEGTDEDGADIGDGYWWEEENTDQEAVDAMVSRAVRELAGEATAAAAWDAVFRHFNTTKGKGDVGYVEGERITVKVNLVTANRLHDNVDAEGNQTRWLGWVNTSPQMIVALLDQLVNVVGAAEEDITVGDTTAYFPNHYWDYCHGRFPGVHYLDWSGTLDRRGAVSSEGQPCETPVFWSGPGAGDALQDYLPVSYAEAEYLINFACLKGHGAGVTLCAKNHYGSFIRIPNEAGYYNLHLSLPPARYSPGMGHYRALVDIMGHSSLGGATLLHFIDGLYGGYWWEGHPYQWEMSPFNDDWPSSLFVSQDPVAIDSVAYDFLLEEWPHVVAAAEMEGGAEDYLHEAALADDPPSGTAYDPDGAGQGLPSLGVHEHWNNPQDKQYSRNLGTGDGIELVAVMISADGDVDNDGQVDLGDFAVFALCMAGPEASPAPPEPITAYGCKAAFDFESDGDVDIHDFAEFQRLVTGP